MLFFVRSPSTRSAGLSASIVAQSDLDARSREAMWKLFSSYYADVTRETFERDLEGKQDVVVLRCKGELQGFSTLTTFERTVQGKPVVCVFSGDTIIAKAFWHQTALQRAFLSYVMKVKLLHPHRPVYWFLISKGFRTYLLLASNFPEYWPRYDRPTPPWQAGIIDDFARLLFPQAWNPDRGILHFDHPAGRLKQDMAPLDDRARQRPEVLFFEERNPHHALGDELCCIGRVDGRLWISYMLKLARRLVRSGREAR